LCDFDQKRQFERKICDKNGLGIFPVLFLDISAQNKEKSPLCCSSAGELEGAFWELDFVQNEVLKVIKQACFYLLFQTQKHIPNRRVWGCSKAVFEARFLFSFGLLPNEQKSRFCTTYMRFWRKNERFLGF